MGDQLKWHHTDDYYPLPNRLYKVKGYNGYFECIKVKDNTSSKGSTVNLNGELVKFQSLEQKFYWKQLNGGNYLDISQNQEFLEFDEHQRAISSFEKEYLDMLESDLG